MFNGTFNTNRLYRAIGIWNIYCVGLHTQSSALPEGPLGVFHPWLWPLKAPGSTFGGGLPGLSPSLWRQYPLMHQRDWDVSSDNRITITSTPTLYQHSGDNKLRCRCIFLSNHCPFFTTIYISRIHNNQVYIYILHHVPNKPGPMPPSEITSLVLL